VARLVEAAGGPKKSSQGVEALTQLGQSSGGGVISTAGLSSASGASSSLSASRPASVTAVGGTALRRRTRLLQILIAAGLGLAGLGLVFLATGHDSFEVVEEAPPSAEPAAPTVAAPAQEEAKAEAPAKEDPPPAPVEPVAREKPHTDATPAAKETKAVSDNPRPTRTSRGRAAAQRSEHEARVPEPSAEKGALGMLSVRAVPWARVEIDGKFIGNSPLANVPVTAGTHSLVLTPGSGDYAGRATEIRVRAGLPTKVVLNFTSGSLNVDQD
jgi:hypothetical protein